jgi:hypothetical protein
MKRAALVACLLLAACGGTPAPEWKAASHDLLERYSNHALRGESKLAETYFSQALAATSATGRIDDAARLWLVRCALETALLDFSACPRYTELARLAPRAEDAAYYHFLQGEASQASALPKAYTGFVNAGTDSAKVRAALEAMDDPRSRLIAAGVAVRRGVVDEATLTLALDTASEQGWRRPLLTYLKLLEARLTARDDPRLPALRKRIELASQP